MFKLSVARACKKEARDRMESKRMPKIDPPEYC